MLHTHTYFRWTGASTFSAMDTVSTTTCPSGHANCKVIDYTSISLLGYENADADAETTPNGEATHHTHWYYKMSIDSTTTVALIYTSACAKGHGSCVFNPVPVNTIVPTAMSEALVETSDAIWDGDNHTHTFSWLESDTYSGIGQGKRACQLGHADCRNIDNVGGIYLPIDLPEGVYYDFDTWNTNEYISDLIRTDHIVEINKLIDHSHTDFDGIGDMVVGNDVDHGDRAAMNVGHYHYHTGHETKVYMDRYIGNWPEHPGSYHG